MAKARTSKTTRHKIVCAAVVLVAALVLIFQICLDLRFWRVTQYPSSEPITSMIIEAVNAVHKPAVIEPTTKKVYLPDANIVLPVQPDSMPNLLYSYTPPSDGSNAEVDVTLTNAVSVGVSKLRSAEGDGLLNHDSNKLFTAVPDLQVCSRGIHVVFGAIATYDHLEFSKALADGRTMYVYSEAHKCAYDLTPLTNYLRQAQSY